MNRKEFVKHCGSCLALLIAPAVLPGCAGTTYVRAPISGGELVIPMNSFEVVRANTTTYRKYVIAENDALQFPICIYRFAADRYQALWMKCTHQGNELHVFGDKLQCPAHGSTFDSLGAVQEGPASEPLRTFTVTITDNELKISLK